MKKVLLILFSLFLVVEMSFSQNDDNSFPFYVPEQSEIGPFFRLNDYLTQFNPSSQKESDDFFNQPLAIGLNNEHMLQTNMILYHIRNTSNPYVKNTFEKFCTEHSNVPEFYKLTLEDLENSTFNNNGLMFRNIPDGNRISYGNLMFISLLDKKINTLIPQGRDWKRILETKDNCVFETSMNGEKLNIEYSFIEETEKKYKARIGKLKKSKSKYSVVFEIPIEGFVAKSNAKEVTIAFDYNNESTKTFFITNYLYSEKDHKTYVVNWKYTLDEKSVFYKCPKYILSYLTKIILFCWIS